MSGCAAQPRTQASSRTIPGPIWKPRESPPLDRRAAEPFPPSAGGSHAFSGHPAAWDGIIPRSRWTSVAPSHQNMDRMTPIRYITIHHDGMRPYFDADERGTMERLEMIRRVHRDRNRWGDIGYHFAVDRSGRVYECRPIAFQGAHVRNYNEGNVGVLALGNFDEQTPTEAQLHAMREYVIRLQRTYNVPASRVLTHREWPGAITACPGRGLQAYVNHLRSRRMLG